MSPRIDNPHVAHVGESRQSDADGKLLGCVHTVDSKDGLTWQCVGCELVTIYDWKAIDDQAELYLAAHGDGVLDAVPLPPCPACGLIPCLNNSDVEYGLDQPHHYTRRALDEHVLQRPKLKGRFAVNRHPEKDRFQGHDFSHLPKAKRPKHHRPVGVRSVRADDVDSGP